MFKGHETDYLPEVVCIVLYNPRTKTLLLEQRLSDDNFKNRWTFTGGKVEEKDREQGDYIAAASIREAKEETGLDVVSYKLLVSFKGLSRNGDNYIFHGVFIEEWNGEIDENREPGKRKLAWLPVGEAQERIGDTEVDKKILEYFLATFSLA